MRLYNQYDACDRALKQLLLGAVDDMFINALSDTHVGYANVTTLQLLKHLYKTYGRITDGDLRRNQEIMVEPFDHNLPIETFFKRIEECVDLAAHAEAPFTTVQVVSSAFYTIKASGLFNDDARDWSRMESSEKTWQNFKVHFTRAYNELKETQDTAKSTGYAANVTNTTASALNNLANAAVADRETMANLTATIHTLSQQLSDTNAKLNQEIERTNKLQAEVTALRAARNRGTQRLIFDKYCWTHGPQCSHTSKDCLS